RVLAAAGCSAFSSDATPTGPWLSNAPPTRPEPASTNSGSPVGGTRYKPLEPASASTTNSVPAGSKASPRGRPNAAYRVDTVPSGSTRYSGSYDDNVGPVTYSAPSGANARWNAATLAGSVANVSARPARSTRKIVPDRSPT